VLNRKRLAAYCSLANGAVLVKQSANRGPTRPESDAQGILPHGERRRTFVEIQALTLVVTEQDLNDAAARHLPDDPEVRKVRLRVAPEGVYVSGVYQMVFGVPFETLWEPAASGGRVTARLAGFKALGIPVAMLKSLILNALRDTVAGVGAVQVDEDGVRVDVERLLADEGLSLRTNLKAVRCLEGRLIVEAAS
jgi:hypothetical protein